MDIATWNVNSINARLPLLLDWLQEHQPDVVCLQETKATHDKFPVEPLAALGYHLAYIGQKTFNGVAILSKTEIVDVNKGLPGDGEDAQKRLIMATVNNIKIINAYIPNGSEVGSEKFAYKLAWLDKLQTLLKEQYDPKQLVLLCGDFNIAPEERDVFSVQEMTNQVGFHPDEHQALQKVKDWGFVDAFRLHNQETEFSWWDYRAVSFRRNRGLRIDHIWVSEPLAKLCTTCWIDKVPRGWEKPSDHTPVIARFDV